MPKVVKSTILDAPIDAAWEMLRDFNGHESWHPAIADSQIERGYPADKIGCVRSFHLADGSELREQLLTLSDLETCFPTASWKPRCRLFNYVAHVRLIPVTDTDRTFWQWDSRFDARAGEAEQMTKLVGEQIYEAGFTAIKQHMGLA